MNAECITAECACAFRNKIIEWKMLFFFGKLKISDAVIKLPKSLSAIHYFVECFGESKYIQPL